MSKKKQLLTTQCQNRKLEFTLEGSDDATGPKKEKAKYYGFIVDEAWIQSVLK